MEPTLKHVHLVMSHIANEIEHTQYMYVHQLCSPSLPARRSLIFDFPFATATAFASLDLVWSGRARAGDTYSQGGLMMYHQAGEEWDGTVNSEVGMLNAQIEESQARFKKIFAQLVEASESRAAWWTGVEALLDQTGMLTPPFCARPPRESNKRERRSTAFAASAGDQAAADGQALLEKTIALAEKKIKTMTLGGGIGKKSKASSEMEKLKALMMNL
jgi:hypothetical protein